MISTMHKSVNGFTTSSKTTISGNNRIPLARSADFHSSIKAGTTSIEITMLLIMAASLSPGLLSGVAHSTRASIH